VTGADEGLAAAGTLLEVQPDHRRLFFFLECGGHLAHGRLPQPGYCGCGRAKLKKFPAAEAFPFHRLPNRFAHAKPHLQSTAGEFPEKNNAIYNLG
jgi:hypothetical protein